VRIGLGDGLHTGIGPRIIDGQLRQHRADVLGARLGQTRRFREPHPVLGERPGLVGADDVDPGQPLDRRKFLNQALPPAQPNHADRERYRCHQHQALRHHRNQCPDHPQYRLPPADVGEEELGVDGQQAGRHQQVGDELQDLIDAVAQLRIHQGELAGLLGQPRGVGLPAHFGGAVATRPGDHEASRHHLVAFDFGDRVGFTGQQRLVDLEAGGLQQFAIDDDLITGAQFDDVIEHHLIGRAFRSPGPAAHGGPGLPDDSQVVQGLLSA